MTSQLQHRQTKHLTQSPPSPLLEHPTKPSPDAQTLILPDGRTLGYAEYGSPSGAPLLYFHGFPTSRLEASGLPSVTSRSDIRFLSLDRPGFGLSTHDPHRRIIDWPADVQAFAAHLGLSRFAILGASGGGPYALACAKQLPEEKLTAVGVVAGAPMWDGGVWTRCVPWYARILYLAANYWPSGTRFMSQMLVGALKWVMRTKLVERKIDGALEAMTTAKAANKKAVEKSNDGDSNYGKSSLPVGTDVEEVDKQQEPVPSTAQRRERLMGLIFEGFAQGTSGFIHETQLLTRDWGIKFEDITYDSVRMWHGSKDANAPVASIRDMAKRMPHCVLKEYDETHYSMGDHFGEILDEMIPKEGPHDDVKGR